MISGSKVNNHSLWFDGKAKEAAEFYCSVFKNSVITSENQIVVTFELDEQKIMFLYGSRESCRTGDNATIKPVCLSRI